MGGKKGDGFSCLHSPANDPFTPFCRSIEFQGRARSADALDRFPLHDRLSRLGWQKDRWQKTGSFSCPHSPANDPSAPFCHSVEFQGRIGRRMGAEE
jgi:hypothetical protein